MTNEIHVCVECVHYLSDKNALTENHIYARCQARFEINLVTGTKTYMFCQARRHSATCKDFEKLEVNYG
jgi:regulator of PEP synthase PpsR (kinase-PPPase family)